MFELVEMLSQRLIELLYSINAEKVMISPAFLTFKKGFTVISVTCPRSAIIILDCPRKISERDILPLTVLTSTPFPAFVFSYCDDVTLSAHARKHDHE